MHSRNVSHKIKMLCSCYSVLLFKQADVLDMAGGRSKLHFTGFEVTGTSSVMDSVLESKGNYSKDLFHHKRTPRRALLWSSTLCCKFKFALLPLASGNVICTHRAVKCYLYLQSSGVRALQKWYKRKSQSYLPVSAGLSTTQGRSVATELLFFKFGFI